MLKIPVISNSTIQIFQEGYGYVFLDANVPSVQFSNIGLDQGQDCLAQTVSQVYAASSHVVAMYNDEGGAVEPRHPRTEAMTTATSGHTKGVVAYDESGGFWLVHSVPRFPSSAGPYSFPYDERIYGQSFLCMSLGLDALSVVGEALQYNDPAFYASTVPPALQNTVPSITAAIRGQRVTAAGTLVKSVRTLGGESFTVFAKNGAWGGELYEDLVAPSLQSNLHCETWIRSPPLPSYCQPQYPYQVLNVRRIAVSDDAQWNETDDHSKWAVADSGSAVCIGDINRMASQAGRGGGTVCMQRNDVHSVMFDIIEASDSCS